MWVSHLKLFCCRSSCLCCNLKFPYHNQIALIIHKLKKIMTTLIHQEKITGVVERVTFHSVQTGWTVLRVSPFNNPTSMITVLVHQAKVFASASMEFYGSWTTQ